MSIATPDAFLARARERRKLMMRSTCRITRPAGERTWDPESGTYEAPERTEIYAGVCQLKPADTSGSTRREPDVGEAEVAAGTVTVVLPWDAPDIQTSDAFELTESDEARLVGRTLPVTFVQYGDSRTHRRIAVSVQDRASVNDA